MDRKITDILPPKEIKKEEVKKPVLEEEIKPKFRKIRTRPPVLFSKSGLIFIFFIIILVGFFSFSTLSKANIDIWPKTDFLILRTEIKVDKNVEEPNFVEKIIPGEIFEKEKTVTENFPVSGKSLKEEKAQGIIRVYNAYSTQPQVFIATTRFVSTDGKTFRTPTKITIPGGHYEGGEFVPGEIDIKVVADEAGPEYNIGPTTFSVPGLAGTDRYTKFYAKSFEPITGGLREEVSKVTEDDLKEAENVLTKKAQQETEVALRNELQSEEISKEFDFLEEAIITKVVESFTLVKPGDEVEDFNFQVKAKSQTIIFKKNDLRDFAKKYILSQISENADQKIYEESLKINIKPETVNLEKGEITLSLEISTKIYPDIAISELKNVLRGKTMLETKVYLENQPEILRAKIRFWPFWVKKIPENPDKIRFKLNID